jgi:hypothetical protein
VDRSERSPLLNLFQRLADRSDCGDQDAVTGSVGTRSHHDCRHRRELHPHQSRSRGPSGRRRPPGARLPADGQRPPVWVILEPVYRENDVSASTSSKKRRPIYEQLLQDVAAGGIDVLLAYSTSRLTRRPMEYERRIDLTARPTSALPLRLLFGEPDDITSACPVHRQHPRPTAEREPTPGLQPRPNDRLGADARPPGCPRP